MCPNGTTGTARAPGLARSPSGFRASGPCTPYTTGRRPGVLHEANRAAVAQSRISRSTRAATRPSSCCCFPPNLRTGRPRHRRSAGRQVSGPIGRRANPGPNSRASPAAPGRNHAWLQLLRKNVAPASRDARPHDATWCGPSAELCSNLRSNECMQRHLVVCEEMLCDEAKVTSSHKRRNSGVGTAKVWVRVRESVQKIVINLRERS